MNKGLRKKRQIWRLLWIGLIGQALLISGCGQEASQNTKSYRNDGYLGLTNTNPNLLNRSGTLYGQDMEMVGQLLKPMKGIKHTEVGFNGDAMNVTLQLNRDLTARERDALRAEAQKILQSNFPRYDVHVDVEV